MEGPEARTLFAEYSGTWVLDTLASDPVLEMPERAPGRAGGGPFGGGGPRGGGVGPGGGGPPGGGGVPGRGGPPRGGFGPQGRAGIDGRGMEAIRDLREAAGHRPERIILELDDSLVTIRQSPGIRAAVPTNGDEIELPGSGGARKARVEWKDLEPRLERSFEGGGRIVDHFQAVGRTRLTLTRTVEIGRMREFRMVFAYDRQER